MSAAKELKRIKSKQLEASRRFNSKQNKLGLVMLAVWIPLEDKEHIKDMCKAAVKAHLLDVVDAA